MNDLTLACRNEQRRDRVRDKQNWNGLDYLEVSEDQRSLTVYFLGKAPKTIAKENIRIEGGRRIRDLEVIDVEIVREDDPELDDWMQVTVDRPGDFSEYQLRVVELDQKGTPTNQPLYGFDPRYAHLSFSFKLNCPTDLDCKQPKACPDQQRLEPEISYLAKDYTSFRQLILDRLSLIMPDWQERHVPDLGITLVELMAYVGDQLSYYQDAVATEAYLGTARQRISIRRHARLMDYHMHEGCNARAWVSIKTDNDISLNPKDIFFITGCNDLLPIDKHTLTEIELEKLAINRSLAGDSQAHPYEVFEPMTQETIQLYKAHSEIYFYTWGDRECCLPRGTTHATLTDQWITSEKTNNGKKSLDSSYNNSTHEKNILLDANGNTNYELNPSKDPCKCPEPEPTPESKRQLNLRVGDVLIFEEILGAKTGNAADADPKHRHIVRLTKVEPGIDTLYNQPIVEVEWAAEEALPFPLCISGIGLAPECKRLEPISVARGNVILVDHGQTIADEFLGIVTKQSVLPQCNGEGQPADLVTIPARFNPQLQKTALSFSQPYPNKGPALRWLLQDPHQALPQIILTGMPEEFVNTKDFCHQISASCLSIINSTENQQTLSLLTKKDSAVAENLTVLMNRTSSQWQWKPQLDLLASHQQDQHFVVEMDNQRQAHLRFGDGELGVMPAIGTEFRATYRIGNGTIGNVGAETISYLVLRNTTVSGVTLTPRNPFPAQGGTDPETLEEVKLFAPQAFRRSLQRAITADDYARLAEQYTDEQGRRVQRAAATLRWTGSWHEVVVAVDPLGQSTADENFLAAIAHYLEQYRRIGHELRVVAARYVPLDVTMTVCVQPHYLRGHVKAALLEQFSNRKLPNGQLGFFHPDNLSFGDSITLSKLIATALTVSGVESVSVTKLQRLHQEPNQELENGILPLGSLEIAQLDSDPSFPENGKLTLELQGGR